jgi:SSS family solute:Na+ symporter
MDIYKQYINNNASDKQTVNVGRISAAFALLIGAVMAPLLGGIDQAFQFIQEYTGIVSPGILAVFVLGLFWKKTTNKAAIWGALVSIPIAIVFKATTWPFLDQMGLTTLLTMLVIALVSLLQNKGGEDEKGIELSSGIFRTSPVFNIGSFAILIVLAALYAMFW